jgi:hypothetical protein
MAIVRDWLIVIALCVLTGWLPTRFLEYRGKVIGDEHNPTVGESAAIGLVFATDIRTLNFTDTVVENGTTIAHQGNLVIQNGFYARPGYSIPVAVFGGAIIPLLTIIGAAHFVARSRRKIRNLAAKVRQSRDSDEFDSR